MDSSLFDESPSRDRTNPPIERMRMKKPEIN
jgi:hypothetical protein